MRHNPEEVIQGFFAEALDSGRARPLPDGTIEVDKDFFDDLTDRLNSEPRGSVLQAILDAAKE